ncbi:MAG: YceI family protein [Siphonobacter aquaeclarae]|nr:YceI family protein [Siphonobacter aquaeclarae]
MKLLLLWLAGLVSLLPSASRKLVADPAASVIRYKMHHPMHDWEGISHQVQSVAVYNDETDRFDAAAVSVTVASFDTKNANRDSHTIEVLEGIKYPRITFSSSRIMQTGSRLAISGNLTFHGVTKPVTIEGTRTDDGNRVVVSGGFPVKMSDYGVERPSLMMVPTDESFEIQFSLVFSRR